MIYTVYEFQSNKMRKHQLSLPLESDTMTSRSDQPFQRGAKQDIM